MPIEDRQQEILDELRHMKGKLWGENGYEGDIQEIKTNVKSLRKDHNKLSRNFYILVGVFVGSGAISASIISVV